MEKGGDGGAGGGSNEGNFFSAVIRSVALFNEMGKKPLGPADPLFVVLLESFHFEEWERPTFDLLFFRFANNKQTKNRLGWG